ncbi:hypothetical protein [Cytobacillus kochii]|nr:hypothetical protein [Cytobacillus kochii]
MTVQELIVELMKVENKDKKIVVDCVLEIESIEETGDGDIELRY